MADRKAQAAAMRGEAGPSTPAGQADRLSGEARQQQEGEARQAAGALALTRPGSPPASPASQDPEPGDEEAHAEDEVLEESEVASELAQDEAEEAPEVLRQRGAAFSASGRFEKAINEYSLALRVVAAGPGDPEQEAQLLNCRSHAFAGLSRQLRSIPASTSEAHALYGLDPTTLAQLALKDAKRAASLRPLCPESRLHQGGALVLLEAYGEAEAAFLEGLALDPAHAGLAAAQEQLARIVAEGASSSPRAAAAPAKRARVAQRTDDVECILCMKLLFEPVTTPCGHTFCRSCFMRAADHSNKCPMCRTVLHVGRELPVTIALANLLEHSFPDEYGARRAESRAAQAPAGEAPLPLFVMACMMPGEKMALNIFEPRYRLMVRRCMEGNRRFGMATVTEDHQPHDVGCACEITECQPLPDGRFYLEIVGRQRFRLLECYEQDGYRVARPAYFDDAPPPAGSPEGAQLEALAASVEALALQWVERVRALAVGRRSLRVAELLERAGDKPPPGQHERLSFWVANMMPIDTSDRVRLLTMTSTLERLRFEDSMLRRSDCGPGGCAIM